MKILNTIFDRAYLLELSSRADCRGTMLRFFEDQAMEDLAPGFTIRDLRVYTLPEPGTFFGIHYYDEENPVNRILTLAQGRGIDYLIDLRPDSPTYLQYVQNELSAENGRAVFIPYGIGHAFISLSENTIQVYGTDATGNIGISKQLNYKESRIGLSLPVPVTAISDYDVNAPFLP